MPVTWASGRAPICVNMLGSGHSPFSVTELKSQVCVDVPAVPEWVYFRGVGEQSWTWVETSREEWWMNECEALGVAQAFRRFQWVPVRVEVELRKLQHARPELGQLVPAPAPDRAAKPLDKRGLLGEEDP